MANQGRHILESVTPSIITETASLAAISARQEGNSTSSIGSETPPKDIDIFELAPLPAGATLHAVAVSVQCFKWGRITVPPRVAFIASGFSAPATPEDTDGIPARWKRVQEWRKQKGKLESFMRGGWRDGTDEEKAFWDFDEYEEEANRNAEQFKTIRGMMDQFKGV